MMATKYEPINYDVGDRIKAAMKVRNISIEEMAKKMCCCTHSVLGYRTRGVKTIDILTNIADILNVSLDWLMGREGPFDDPKKVQEKENGQMVKEGVTHD